MRHRSALAWMLALCLSSAQAIEAPAGSAPAQVTPTDESAFHRVLQRSAHHRNLTGLAVAPAVIDALAAGNAAGAIDLLSRQAAGGNQDANIALVRIQHWCNRISTTRLPDAKTQIAQLPPALSPDRAARVAGVIVADEKYRQVAVGSCANARFDYGAIEARLRASAEAGDPSSATELAQFTRDPKRRQELLEGAAAKGFAPAQYILANGRLIAVQRGQTTENVASIRILLKQAGLSINKAKVDLANCMAIGCDGHPADAAGAAAFGTDAARDGEPSAFLSMARMPWGMRMPRVQMLAWQYFGDRLSESGCVGEGYLNASLTFDQTIRAFEQQLDPKGLEQARERAESLWRDHSQRAMREQGCLIVDG